jgi:hypothetical protein
MLNAVGAFENESKHKAVYYWKSNYGGFCNSNLAAAIKSNLEI